MRRHLLSFCLLMTLTACGGGTGEMDWFRYAPGGAGTIQPTPAQPAQGYNGQPLAPGIHRIDDPDQPIEGYTIDYVWADTPEIAERKCKDIAAAAGLSFNGVRRTSRNGSRWECNVLSNYPEPERIPPRSPYNP